MIMKVDHCSPRSYEDSQSNQLIECTIKEELSSDVISKQDSKRGICWSELQRANMAQWTPQCEKLGVQDGENSENHQQISSCIIQKDEDGEAVTPQSLMSQDIRKRNCPFEEVKPAKRGTPSRKRSDTSIVRWPANRYKQAEQSLFKILREQGAVFGKPITRQQLRELARKCIADTGLLDHLLKHLDGKVVPGGTDRFRRRFNPEGFLEYWLESADLDGSRREAGGGDRFWVPLSCVKLENGPLEEHVSSIELKFLQDEMTNMKRLLEEVASKKRDLDGEANPVKSWHKDFINWTTKTSQRITEVSSSLASMQDMCKDMVMWKEKTEGHLVEISSSLNSMQAAKQSTQPLDRYEDWLDNSALDSINGEDFPDWLLSEPITNADRDMVLYDPCSSLPGKPEPDNVISPKPDCASEVLMLKEELAKLKSEMKELKPKKQEESFFNWLKGGSFNVNPKLGINNQWLCLQEMLELLKWKPKMEQQLMELSNAVNNMHTPKQLIPFKVHNYYM